MSTRTMTMFTNDFGINRGRASPLFRVTKPASHFAEAVAAIADTLAEGVERSIAGVAAWNRRRRTYAELARLDDHLLRDIGLSRDGLPSQVARLEAAQRLRGRPS